MGAVNGKVVFITGGARGVGADLARRLRRKGAELVLTDIDAEPLAELAAELGSDHVLTAVADVRDLEAMQVVAQHAIERFGGIDVVVANAGIASTGATFNATHPEAGERVLEVNLLGVHRTVAAALPQIIANRGHVVVVASVYAFINGVGAAPYAMAKAGVEQLGRALRIELAPHGASASVAYFGFIDTAMVHQALDADPLSDQVFSQLPKPLLKRLQPAQAGEAIAKGIDRRAPRIIAPKRWTILSVLRGIVNPIADRAMERDAKLMAVVREMDARADMEQKTTA